ncbi:MAG: putative lipoprotein [bacterium]|nr:putative lipoprotein [bacterium]
MKRILLLALFAAAAAGCVRVKPYERELLAKPTMTFQPDPHEDVLDNHMLEAREGASGGYGSAGGGCGCN